MKVVIKVHFPGCPLEVAHHMLLSGNPSAIDEVQTAASRVYNHLKSGHVSPGWCVKLPADRQYYVVVTPTRENALGQGGEEVDITRAGATPEAPY